MKVHFVDIFSGMPVPVTWTQLAETASAGSTQLVLQQAVTWKAGDQIVIASTGHRHSQRQNEDVFITGLSNELLSWRKKSAFFFNRNHSQPFKIQLLLLQDSVRLDLKSEIAVI